MEQHPEIVEMATQSEVGTETPLQVETVAQLSPEERAELQEFKKNKAYFQSLTDKKISETQRELAEEKVRREIYERELAELKNPKPVERPLVKPVKPFKPEDFDPIDALTRGTPSYRYAEEHANYLEKLTEYNETLALRKEQQIDEKLKSFNEIAEQEKKKHEFLQYQQNLAIKLQAEGLDEASAIEAAKFFTSQDSGEPKTLTQMWKAIKASSPKPTYQTPPAPTGGGGSPKPEGDFTKSKDTSWIYKTK